MDQFECVLGVFLIWLTSTAAAQPQGSGQGERDTYDMADRDDDQVCME